MHSQHKKLADGGWGQLTLLEQLGNVGSEVGRALKAQEKGDEQQSQRCLDRALELLDLTIADPKHRKRLKELCRLREVICDYFFGENIFGSTSPLLENYFTYFAIAARR